MGLLLPTTKRTGRIFFDTLLAGLEGVGASNIRHDGRPGRAGSFIRCTYGGKAYLMHYSPTPAPRKVSSVIDVFKRLNLIPTEPKVKRIKEPLKHAA